jgi:hypothetical protein
MEGHGYCVIAWRYKVSKEIKGRAALVFIATLILCISLNTGCGGLRRSSAGYVWEELSEHMDYSLVNASILNQNQIWAINWTDTGHRDSEVVFYNGSNWERQYLAESTLLTYIYALDDSHVWAVGGKGSEGEMRGVIYFFNGVTWELQYEERGMSGFLGIVASDASHVWATSRGVYFFDGQTWTRQYASEERFQTIASYNSANAWAASESGIVYHFNGIVWEEQQALFGTDANVFISYARSFALDSYSVWLAVYNTESLECKVFFYDGSRWNEQITMPYDIIVASVFALNEEHVWAAGGSGSNIPCPILFYDGKEWHIQHEFDESIVGIRALEENMAIAVSESGSIYLGTSD